MTGRLPATSVAALDVARADPESTGAVRLTAGGDGVALGVRDGRPVTVGLFRPDPMHALLVGPLALAQLVVLRAVAVGARVRVETSRPTGWQSFVHLAAGNTGMISFAGGGDTAGTAGTPVLDVVDLEQGGAAEHRRSAPWSTVLTVHDRLSRWNADELGGFDLVLTRGLDRTESRTIAAALNLPAAERALTGLPDGVLGIAGRTGVRVTPIAQTSVEHWLLGPLGPVPPRG